MNWHPSAGDPTAPGWTITAGYLITAVLCARRAYGSRQANDPHFQPGDFTAWSCLSAFTFALGINKQLDFQTLLVEWGRTLLSGSPAFAHRRALQKAFFVLIAATLLGAGIYWRCRIIRFARNEPAAVSGLLILTLTILIRAADINHLTLPGLPIGGENSPWWVLELAGLILLTLGASGRRKVRSSRT